MDTITQNITKNNVVLAIQLQKSQKRLTLTHNCCYLSYFRQSLIGICVMIAYYIKKKIVPDT